MANSSIKTAKQIFEVLEYFEDVKRPISRKEVSTKCDYPTSSAAALLKSMVVLGYLSYDSYNRTYLPTMRIAQMGGWLNTGLFGDSAILALVDYVHQELDELVSISTQSDLHAQYIHCLQTSKRLRLKITPGEVRPLAISGVRRPFPQRPHRRRDCATSAPHKCRLSSRRADRTECADEHDQWHPTCGSHVLQAHHRPGRRSDCRPAAKA